MIKNKSLEITERGKKRRTTINNKPDNDEIESGLKIIILNKGNTFVMMTSLRAHFSPVKNVFQ